MRNKRHPEDELPIPLRQYLDVKKQADTLPLSPSVELGLAKARQAALRRFAAQKNNTQRLTDILGWASFGHPRMVGAAALSVCLVVGVMLMMVSQPEDAMLLGADLPLEAFVDNGFEPWHYSDQI
ncbi:DUF3619 family protein [Methylophilus aquaticus]|uniref:DUF3619 family protein n=1 Tax=Methylophilus aquaticus TaxID=1971610 RepID=A0ABT9JPN5_9PROT|nr:DUF3619 family protein [Methylophilus aquaticus]MDP8566518.1 DUF3619 family protein [Methylophilus aquaticus]